MRITAKRGSDNFPPQQEPPSLLKRIAAFVVSLFSRYSKEAQVIIKKLEEDEYELSDDDKKSIDKFCAAVKKQTAEGGSNKGPAVAAIFTIGNSFAKKKLIQLVVRSDGPNIDVLLPKGKELGVGASGVVVEATKLMGNESKIVVKKPAAFAPPDQEEEIKDGLAHEAKILSKAYQGIDPSKVIGLPRSTALVDSRFYNEYNEQDYKTIIEKDDKGKFILPPEEKPTEEPIKTANNKLAGYRSTYLLAQQYDGDLFSYFTQQPTHQQLCSVFAQSAQGLAFLHKKNIAHRDMKPNNILVRTLDDKSKNEAVITDFESAVLLDPEEIKKSEWSYSKVHTIQYTFREEENEYTELAQNIIETKKDINDPNKEVDKEKNLAKLQADMEAFQQLNKQQDVFAFCYLIVLMTDTSDKIKINGNIAKGSIHGRIETFEVLPDLEKALTDKGLSTDAAKLIIQGLSQNREERPTAQQLANALSPYLATPPPAI